jgi:hypothetical protein
MFVILSKHDPSWNQLLEPRGLPEIEKNDRNTRQARGCQIFLDTKYQNGGKYTKLPQNIANVHKIYQVAVK